MKAQYCINLTFSSELTDEQKDEIISNIRKSLEHTRDTIGIVPETVEGFTKEIEVTRITSATDSLYELWDVVKTEGNCKEYVNEMFKQLELLGTETNTLTKNMIYNKLNSLKSKLDEIN